MSPPADGSPIVWVERALATAVTAVLAALHLRFLWSAGGLWRDEVHGVNVATLPSWGAVWSHMPFDSFPALWFALLRGWTALVSPESDFGIRVLGLLIGLGILAVLWRNARALGHGLPLLSLVLFGLNAAVISFGDSIRGHGLGMLTGLLALGLIFEFSVEPTRMRGLLALLGALLAVHSLYYNVVLVLAACAGGGAISAVKRSSRALAGIMAVGALTAASILPYTLLFRRAREWDMVIRVPVDLPWIWLKIREAFAPSGPAALWLFLALAVTGIACAFAPTPASVGPAYERERLAAFYCGVVIVVAVAAYVLFLKRLGYVTQPWYYLGLIAIVGASLDAPVARLCRSGAARWTRAGMVALLAVIALPPAWSFAGIRRTNVDLVAARIASMAAPGDLVVVCPWYLGLTYDRYASSRAGWVTIPPVYDHKFHREDLLKQALMSRRAVGPVLSAMSDAMATGHRVFWVGDLFMPQPGTIPDDPAPAPNPESGWSDAPYYEAWGLQAGHLIRSHAKVADRIEVPVDRAVSPYEDAALYVFSGWWESR